MRVSGESLRPFGSEFLSFVRCVPIVLSLVAVIGLTGGQIGGYFGVDKLVDYNDRALSHGVGFALTVVLLHCLSIGYLIIRAESARRAEVGGDDYELSFWAIMPLSGAVLAIVGCAIFGLKPTALGILETIGKDEFYLGLLMALALFLSCHALAALVGSLLGQYRNEIIEKCLEMRAEDMSEFLWGMALLLFSLFGVWIASTGAGSVHSSFGVSSWWMFLVGVSLSTLLLVSVVLGFPPWAGKLRGGLIRAVGAESLLSTKKGFQHATGWLMFLLFSLIVLSLASRERLWILGGSPMTTVCSMWVFILAMYALLRNILLRLPMAIVAVFLIALLLGGRDPYRYPVIEDDHYSKENLLNLEEARLGDVKRLRKRKQSPDRLASFQKNRVVPPQGSWPKEDKNDRLLQISDLSFPRYQTANRPLESRPIVLIAVSGGGLRAAAWTYAVLSRLDEALAKEGIDFASHVRLVCGASGGMFGASYYSTNLADFGDRQKRLPAAPTSNENSLPDSYKKLTQDYLRPVINALVYHDIPFTLSPFHANTDRGKVLQEIWEKLPSRTQGVTMRSPFSELRQKEAAGEIPSLAFAPMIVEDGRRLIISNLDFRHVAMNSGNGIVQPGNMFSIDALEMFRLFPEWKNKINLAIASRLSASFPYVSPAAILPTKPRLRLVDAGYYDNYGISLVASWLFSNSHQTVLKQKQVRRVLIIQIRDGPSEANRTLGVGSQTPTSDPQVFQENSTPRHRAIEDLTTPLSGFYTGQNSSSSFRNDGMLELLNQFYRQRSKLDNRAAKVDRLAKNTLSTLTLEFNGNASLNWYLPDDEKQIIWQASFDAAIQKRIAAAIVWWKKSVE